MKTNYGLIYSLVGLLGVGCNPEVVSSTKTSPAATMISGASAIGGPANLTLSGPVSVSTTDCSAFAVSVKDAALHTVAATSALTVDLISSGSGAYFSDSLCTVPILQTFIASGGSSAIVYYKDAAVQNAILFANAATLPPGNALSVGVVSSTQKLGVSGISAYLARNTCSAAVTVRALDGTNSPITVASILTVSLAGTGTTLFYSSAGCGGAPVGSVAIADG